MQSRNEADTELARNMRDGKVAEKLNYAQEKHMAEVRILKARATTQQCVAWLMVWALFWFAIAIAAAGWKVSTYFMQTWQPTF